MIMIIRLIAPGVEVWTQWQMGRSITGTHVCRCAECVCYYKFLSVCRLSFKFLLDLQFSKKHSHVIVKWVKYLRQKLSNVSAPIFPKYFFNITICPSWQQLKLLPKPLAFLHRIKKCGGGRLYCMKCLFFIAHVAHIRRANPKHNIYRQYPGFSIIEIVNLSFEV